MAKAIFARIEAQPLRAILVLGLLLRILASCYSPGYLMHDDHFLVIETGASWAEGEDYNNWLPEGQKRNGIDSPSPHQANLAYPGIVSVFFRACHFVGLVQPSKQMVLLRLLHGIFSLLVVLLGYRIAFHIGGRKPAIWSGLALAAFGLFPILGVRQLVEVVCIPPLLWSAWTVLRSDPGLRTPRTWVVAGIGLGLATALRYQCGVFGLGWVIAIFLHEPNRLEALKTSILLGISALLTFAIGQLQDWWIWGEPFAQLQAYIAYNTENAGGYPQGFWHQYVWVVLGLLIPPFSFAWVFGTFKVWKKHALLVLPPLAFFVFHSYFPNKQERFILPSAPFFVIAGSVGWAAFEASSLFWKRHARLRSVLVGMGVTVSLILGIGLCFIQPKQSRVDAMTMLYEQGDLENFLLVHTDGGAMPPQFYSGSWAHYWTSDLSTDELNHRNVMCNSPRYIFPNYLVFSGRQHLGEGIERYKETYPSMEYIGQVPPSRWDRLLASFNPHNPIERWMIYRISKDQACP